MAADSAADRIAFVLYSLGELVFFEPAHRVGPKLKAMLATDCKSWFDSITSPNSCGEGQEKPGEHPFGPGGDPLGAHLVATSGLVDKDLGGSQALIQLRGLSRSKEKESSVKVEHVHADDMSPHVLARP